MISISARLLTNWAGGAQCSPMPTTATGAEPRGLTSLRAANRRRLLAELMLHRAISQASLARATGLSPTTVSSLIGEFAADGLITEAGNADRVGGRTGRPGRLLTFVGPRDLVLGIDCGHDQMRMALADMAGTILNESTVNDDIDGLGAGVFSLIKEGFGALCAEAGVECTQVVQAALGVPGLVHDGEVRSPRMPAWADLNLAQHSEKAIGIRTLIENDANLAAMGEHSFGVARGQEDVVYLKISAGIGAGLVLGGQLHRGPRGGAGEPGHIQVREDGTMCSCGNRGCLETVASIPQALQAIRDVHPEARTAADLSALILAGDRSAVRVVTDMGREIGKVVADLCNWLAPSSVVVGGDLATVPGPNGASAADPLISSIAAAVSRYSLPRIAFYTQVLAGTLGPRAGVLGAVSAAQAAADPARLQHRL